MARPLSGKTAKVIIDEHQLTTLASIGCTQEEMAAFFKCSVDTIKRNYAEALKTGVEQGKVSARRIIWEQFKKGNTVAIKYIVHNVLKESVEKIEIKGELGIYAQMVKAMKEVEDED